MSLSLNGSGHSNNTSSNPWTVTLSNMSAGDVIIVDVGYTSGTVSSLSASGITFDGTRHANAGANDRWRGVANSSGTSVVITVNFSISNTGVANAYSISGANTSASFDAGGPVTGTGSPSDPKSITPFNNNTMVIAFFSMNSVQNPTTGTPGQNGAGQTMISGADFYASEYIILSSAIAQSMGLDNSPHGNGDSRAAIVDAVVAAGATAPNPLILMSTRLIQ